MGLDGLAYFQVSSESELFTGEADTARTAALISLMQLSVGIVPQSATSTPRGQPTQTGILGTAEHVEQGSLWHGPFCMSSAREASSGLTARRLYENCRCRCNITKGIDLRDVGRGRPRRIPTVIVKNRIRGLYRRWPPRAAVICFDEWGPLEVRPTPSLSHRR